METLYLCFGKTTVVSLFKMVAYLRSSETSPFGFLSNKAKEIVRYANSVMIGQQQEQYVPPQQTQSSAASAEEYVSVQQQNVYYPTPSVPEGGGEHQSMAASLNAACQAAVAALSQFTHLVGTMDATRALARAGQFMGHGPMPLPVGLSSPYMSGGRSFKRGCPGSLGNWSGGSREDAEAGTSAHAPEIATVVAAHPKTSLWCGLCRVDCTSPEMPEQHKNGKNHKKSMLNEQTEAVVLLICVMCNVKCNTQEVLDIRMKGKKHISKCKSFKANHTFLH